MKTILLLLAGLSGLALAAEPPAPETPPQGLTSSDWSSIRAAYEAGRHFAHRQQDGTLTARNPGQQWRTDFDGKGFLTTPDHGQWTWGLELTGYGERTLLSAPSTLTQDDGKITCQRDENLTEWFINDTRGLEQGWTISSRSVGVSPTSSPLTLTLALRGDLKPQLSPDSSSVSFQTTSGGTALTYGGLKAWDADGKKLTVRFEPAGETAIRIAVEDQNARYPITIDPIAQQAYLKASNTGYDDEFGGSVAVSGDTVVVGAHLEDSSTTGVNSAHNEGARNSGAAYVFTRSGTTWSQQAYLKASNTGADDRFGYSVAVSGDSVVVGAHGEDSSTTGVNSTPNDTGGIFFNSGAAYVFTRSGTTWSQQAYLKASNTGEGDSFGWSVAVSGDTVVVGAYGEDSSTTGVNSTPNESASYSGAAYVFTRSGTTWSQHAYLKASNTGSLDFFGIFFGYSVAVSGDTVVVGANNETSSTTGVNSTPNESASYTGAAYVFTRSGTTWSQQAYLKASNTGGGDQFGISVAVSGDTVVVGAQYEGSSTTGVNSTPNENAQNSGAAYVFTRSGTTWSQQAYLKASNTGEGDSFGISVAVSGDTVVVGAIGENSSTTGVNSTPNDSFISSGAAYVFTRSGAIWSQQAYLKASNTRDFDNFGISVAVSGDTVVVGASRENSGTTGVNSTPNQSGEQSGAAYIFSGLGPVIGPPEIAIQLAGADIVADTTQSAGSLVVGTNSDLVFTLFNTGTGPLTLTGTPQVAVSGSPDFSVTSQPASPVTGPSGSTTFTVRFAPSSIGPKNAVLSIPNNDADENPFSINLSGTGVIPPAPEIAVEEPAGTNLADDSAALDFGNSNIGTPVIKTITVRNTGTADLTGLGVSHSGANASDFLLGPLGSTTLAQGASTTFTVSFSPTAAGSRSTAILIASNDTDENPFDIMLNGTGVIPPAPEIVVEEPAGTDLVDGNAALAFGSSNIGTPVVKTLTVRNTGTANLTGLAVSRSGVNASEFATSALGSTTLAPGASTTFKATFTPTAAGARSAALQIASNDATENPFDITLSGTGVDTTVPAPEIVVEEPAGTDLIDGTAALAFGSSNIGTPVVKTLTVRNTGTANLTGLAVSRSGANASEFALGLLGSTTLVPGASTTFTATFTPTAAGVRSAALQISSNDADENPFDIDLSGTGIAVNPYDITFVGTPYELRIGNQVTFDLNRLRNPGETLKVSGKIPTGLKFNALTGQLTGILAGKAGTYQVSVQVLQGRSVIRTITLPIAVLDFPTSLIGNFDFLMEDSNSVPVGVCKITITRANQWSATLESAGSSKKRSAKGTFILAEGSPVAPITAPFPADTGAPAVTVNISLNSLTPSITGTYNGGTLRGFRIAKAGELPPATVAYSLVLDASEQNGINLPAGLGWLKGKVSNQGIGAFKGLLGDGTAASISLRLSAFGQAILWSQPYKIKSSYIGGIVTLGNLGQPTPGESPLTNEVWWTKTADASTLSYPSGFPGMTVTVGTSRWTAPASAIAMGSSLGWRDNSKTSIVINGAGLSNQDPQSTSASLPTEFTMDSTFALATSLPAGATPVAWKGKASKTDGAISGAFTIPAGFSSELSSGSAAVSGVLVQDEPWGTTTGCGQIKVPVAGPKGSFKTASIVLGQ